MRLRKLAALLFSSALVLPLVGCGTPEAPAPATNDTPAATGGAMEGTEAGDAAAETDTDTDADWDDDTTTGN